MEYTETLIKKLNNKPSDSLKEWTIKTILKTYGWKTSWDHLIKGEMAYFKGNRIITISKPWWGFEKRLQIIDLTCDTKKTQITKLSRVNIKTFKQFIKTFEKETTENENEQY